MRHTLTRQRLYDMIWERAVSKVAPELNISDVALRKQCIKHAIPLPDAVYWGKRHAGKPVRRKPLPPLPQNISDTIVTIPRAVGAAPEAVKSAIRAARGLRPTPLPKRKDSLVALTLDAAKRATQDRERGGISHLGAGFFNVRVHPDALDRLEHFLSALVHAARGHGYDFAGSSEGLHMVVEGEAIEFRTVQTIRRSRHIATAEETRRVDRWDADRTRRGDWRIAQDRPMIPWWDFTHTGEMSIEIGGWSRFAGATHRFADTRARKIEERVEDIIVSFAAYAAGIKVRRAEDAERARLEAAAQAERARLARLAELETQHVRWLEARLDEQDNCARLRAFVERLPAEGEGAYGLLVRWVTERLVAAESRLSADAIAAQVSAMEAFAEQTVNI